METAHVSVGVYQPRQILAVPGADQPPSPGSMLHTGSAPTCPNHVSKFHEGGEPEKSFADAGRALIGAHFGFEASSFFEEAGNRPGIGQVFIVIDPAALAGNASYLARVEVLVTEMLGDEGVRLPGARRDALLERAVAEGIEVADSLLAALRGG